MEELKIYRVSDEYIEYLQKTDARVQNNKDRRRPYVGVVLYVGEYKYFVPMESPKPNHKNIKNGKHLFKIEGGTLGMLGFNNMIPVRDSEITQVYAEQEEEKYGNLIRRQIASCNRSKSEIHDKAGRTYYDVVSGKNQFLVRISCDFKRLEQACNEYGGK